MSSKVMRSLGAKGCGLTIDLTDSLVSTLTSTSGRPESDCALVEEGFISIHGRGVGDNCTSCDE